MPAPIALPTSSDEIARQSRQDARTAASRHSSTQGIRMPSQRIEKLEMKNLQDPGHVWVRHVFRIVNYG